MTARTETGQEALLRAPARLRVDVTRVLRFYRDFADFARSNDFDTEQMADAPNSELVNKTVLQAAGRSAERLLEFAGEECARPYDVM